jgi:hypothetical protein
MVKWLLIGESLLKLSILSAMRALRPNFGEDKKQILKDRVEMLWQA